MTLPPVNRRAALFARILDLLPQALRGLDRNEPDHTFLDVSKTPLGEGLAPPPPAASEEIRSRIAPLIASGAVDEGSRRVLDTMIDSWVDEWTVQMERERVRRESVLHQIESDAATRTEILQQRAKYKREEAAALKEYEDELRNRQGRRARSRRHRTDSNQPSDEGEPAPVTTTETALSAAPDPPTPPPTDMTPLSSDSQGRFRPRAEQVITYVVLTVLALADAFGFWTTLDRLIKQDTYLVAFFVVALALGSVAAAHAVGKLLRSYREGYGGSATWITVISLLWLALGCTIAAIRATTGGAGSSVGSGRLAQNAATKLSADNVWIAVLMLAVYLVTGALAMTHAYRFGDPTTIEERETRKRRLKLETEIAELDARARLEQAREKVAAENRKRANELHDREQELDQSFRAVLRSEQAQPIAAAEGNPSATDSLLDPDDDHPENPDR